MVGKGKENKWSVSTNFRTLPSLSAFVSDKTLWTKFQNFARYYTILKVIIINFEVVTPLPYNKLRHLITNYIYLRGKGGYTVFMPPPQHATAVMGGIAP